MVRGIGVDTVYIPRIKQILKDHPSKFLVKFFHPEEIIAANQLNQANFIAKRFAAKEALLKALGIGMRAVKLADIGVVNNAIGKPQFLLSPKIRADYQLEPESCLISLTDDKDYATAFVLIKS